MWFKYIYYSVYEYICIPILVFLLQRNLFFTPVYTSDKSCQFLVCFRLVTFYLWRHEIDYYDFVIFGRHSYENLQHSFTILFLEGQCIGFWSQETIKVSIYKSWFFSVWKLRWHCNDSKPWQCLLKHKP